MKTTSKLPRLVCPMKFRLIITNKADYSQEPEDGVLRFSNSQWLADPAKLEGYQFNDVIVKCSLDESLRKWLHMHIGVRVDRIIYTAA